MIVAIIIWNGITIEIGSKDNFMYLRMELYPLSRFFKG